MCESYQKHLVGKEPVNDVTDDTVVLHEDHNVHLSTQYCLEVDSFHGKKLVEQM